MPRHQTYFDVFHHTAPMIERERFSLTSPTCPAKHQTKSLSYAVALLGASVTEEHTYLEEKLYHYSRKYLELTERQEDMTDFISLDTLQACVLVTWYELKGTNFTRAWMSLGRAIRLAKMLGLDQMDQEQQVEQDSDFRLDLPRTGGPAELEERRRTFWVLFIFDAYASVRTGARMTLREDQVISLTFLLRAIHYFESMKY